MSDQAAVVRWCVGPVVVFAATVAAVFVPAAYHGREVAPNALNVVAVLIPAVLLGPDLRAWRRLPPSKSRIVRRQLVMASVLLVFLLPTVHPVPQEHSIQLMISAVFGAAGAADLLIWRVRSSAALGYLGGVGLLLLAMPLMSGLDEPSRQNGLIHGIAWTVFGLIGITGIGVWLSASVVALVETVALLRGGELEWLVPPPAAFCRDR